MASPVLLAQVLLNALSASLVGALAVIVLRHGRGGDAGRALTRFGVWWGALALSVLCTLASIALTARVPGSAPAVVALQYVGLALLSTAIWGFVSYLAYVFTGRGVMFAVADIVGALQFVGAVMFLESLDPRGLALTSAGAVPVFAREPSALVGVAFAILYFAIPLAASLGLLIVRSRALDPTTRWRSMALGAATTVWFVVGILLAGSPVPFVSAVLGPALAVLTALLVLLTYRPPAWLREKGLAPFGAKGQQANPS